jgi:hypothetical protein
MVTHFIEQCSSRVARRLLIVSAVLLAAMVAALGLSSRYFYNVICGPFAIENDALVGLTDVKNLQQYFITVNGEDSLNTGIDEMATHTRDDGKNPSETLVAHHVAVLVNKRLLLVRTPAYEEGETQFSGTLQPIPGDIQHEVIDSLKADIPELNEAFLPFMLSREDIRTSGRIELALGVILLLLALAYFIRNVRQQVNPQTQSIYKTLGDYGPVQAIVGAIDAEVAGPGCVKIGKATVTPHWLIQTKPFRLDVVRLDDVVWMYQKVTEQRTYFIKTGETYTALFWTKQGKSIEVSGKQADVTSMLVQVAHHAPWVMRGFTKDRDKAWRTNRQQVIQMVMDQQKSLKEQNAMGIDTSGVTGTEAA